MRTCGFANAAASSVRSATAGESPPVLSNSSLSVLHPHIATSISKAASHAKGFRFAGVFIIFEKYKKP